MNDYFSIGQSNQPAFNGHNFHSYETSTILKIGAIVFGLLLIAGAVTAHYYQINAIAVYSIGVAGGLFILITALTSVVQCILARRHSKVNEDTTQIPIKQETKTEKSTSEIDKEEASNKNEPNEEHSLSTEISKSTQEISDTPAKKRKKVKGSIAIFNPARSGALGRKLDFLWADTQAVERIDGKSWKDFPEEMLVECVLFNLNLGEKKQIVLPLCLFIEKDDYCQLKCDGDRVEFFDEKYHYQLTINQQNAPVSFKISFQEAIEKCKWTYSHNEGRSNIPNSGDELYYSPIELGKSEHMRKQFTKNLKSDHFLHDLQHSLIPIHHHVQNKILIEQRFKETDVQIIRTTDAFAIFIPQYDFDPNFDPKKDDGPWIIAPNRPPYLLVIDYTNDLTPEMIAEVKLQKYTSGGLEVSWAAKKTTKSVGKGTHKKKAIKKPNLKKDKPSPEILSQLPGWLKDSVTNIPYVKFPDRPVKYEDFDIFTNPVILFSAGETIGLYMKLCVEHHCVDASYDRTRNHSEDELIDMQQSSKEPFTIRCVSFPPRLNDTYWYLISEEGRRIKHRNAPFDTNDILGSNRFGGHSDIVLVQTRIDEYLNTANQDRLSDAKKHRYDLAWIVLRLLQERSCEVRELRTDTLFNRYVDPVVGYWKVSIPKKS